MLTRVSFPPAPVGPNKSRPVLPGSTAERKSVISVFVPACRLHETCSKPTPPADGPRAKRLERFVPSPAVQRPDREDTRYTTEARPDCSMFAI